MFLLSEARLVWSGSKKGFFQVLHKKISIGWGHLSAHGGAVYLLVHVACKLENVVFEDKVK